MKKTFLFAAAAALIVASCGAPSTTSVNGFFSEDTTETEVQIVVGVEDTTIVLDNAKFALTVPTDVTALAYAMGDGMQIPFVADGTAITLDFVAGKAKSSGKGVNYRLEKYQEWVEEFMKNYSEEVSAPGLTDEDQEEITERAIGEFNDYLEKTVYKNKDNVLGLLAASNIQMDDDERYLKILKSLAPVFQQEPRIQNAIKALETAADTAEGSPFADFEILQDPEDPSSLVKFSDFIGRGKYVLVDFWASWCGPCRGEMPNLRAVYDEFHGDLFDMLSVAVWDRPEDTVAAAKEENILWNQIINAQQIPTDLYGIQGIPHIILFGPDGTILRRNLRGAAIREAVAAALGAE